jgi:hypothetical protein
VQTGQVVCQDMFGPHDLGQLGDQFGLKRSRQRDVGGVDSWGRTSTEECIDQGESPISQRSGLSRVAPTGPVHLGSRDREVGRVTTSHVLQCYI